MSQRPYRIVLLAALAGAVSAALAAALLINIFERKEERHATGDARVRLRAVPRGVLLQRQGEAPDLSGFSDFVHAEAGSPVLKAQHPEFEMWSQGVHARSGVACADCHMPYQRTGAHKISDHHVRSPLLNIANACQPCHPFPEEELRARAEAIQGRTYELRNRAMDAVVALISDLKLRGPTADPAAQERARHLHRRAQFLLDFVEAENSTGFHAPQEALRILAVSIDEARQGQLALREGSSPSGNAAP